MIVVIKTVVHRVTLLWEVVQGGEKQKGRKSTKQIERGDQKRGGPGEKDKSTEGIPRCWRKPA
jgi:hypothetical protein